MGLFGKLFSKKPAKPPVWARAAFKEDIASFEAFVDVVATVRDDREYAFSDDDIRSGSAQFSANGQNVEWIFEGVAEECARTAVTGWRALVEQSDPLGENETNAEAELDALQPAPDTKAWIIANAPWGGVLLESHHDKLVVIAMPISDPAPFETIPAFPPGMIEAVIVCNTRGGHLAGAKLARAAGLDHVLALDPAKPVGGEIAVRALERTSFGPLELEPEAGAVFGRWTNATVLVGDTITLSQIGALQPAHVVGRVVVDGQPSDKVVNALMRLRKVLLLANLPDANAELNAQMFAALGVTAEIATPPQPVSRKQQIIAYALMDQLDKADAVAVEGIALGDDAEDMHFQRAMLALMRDDEVLADAELASIGTPQSLCSRATIAAMRGDRVARELAIKALAQLPGDKIAIRCAITAHYLTGDAATAKQLLAEHGSHLDAEVRIGLEQAVADPRSIKLERRHTFPEHAEVALRSIAPMIDAGQFAAAEKLLRKARTWDPSNIAITAELGVALAKQNKFQEAVAVYDETIARGGSAVLLKFNRGNCYLQLGKLAEAAADYRACLAIKPDWDGPRQNLAAVEQLSR